MEQSGELRSSFGSRVDLCGTFRRDIILRSSSKVIFGPRMELGASTPSSSKVSTLETS